MSPWALAGVSGVRRRRGSRRRVRAIHRWAKPARSPSTRRRPASVADRSESGIAASRVIDRLVSRFPGGAPRRRCTAVRWPWCFPRPSASRSAGCSGCLLLTRDQRLITSRRDVVLRSLSLSLRHSRAVSNLCWLRTPGARTGNPNRPGSTSGHPLPTPSCSVRGPGRSRSRSECTVPLLVGCSGIVGQVQAAPMSGFA